MRQCQCLSPQRGVALITALLVVSLASIAAVAVASAGFQALSRTQLLLDSERAWWYAQGMEAWAVTILEREGAQTEVDHLGEVWARQVPPLPVEGGALQGRIEDAQGRFNLNNLAVDNDEQRARYIEQFARLMRCVDAGDDFNARDIANAIIDWVDVDEEQRFPGGGEDLLYLGKVPPYRTSGQLFATASELLLINGVDDDIFRALSPHIVALPQITAINLNTAQPEVLCALSDNADFRARIEDFAEVRANQPLESVAAAFQEGGLVPAGTPEIQQQDLTVSSNYFLTEAEAFIGNGSALLYSLVSRPDQGVPTVLRRSTARP
ncbi:type II secretion system minor pseudopilin GspK [Algiphilus sp.]|uniref:type II secretion system minor pseudopilin GspK n=1 Tax=Algiphilus sp. TaxID=1872431 RepID=UPI003B518C98